MGMNISIDDGWDRMPAPVALQKTYFETALQKRGAYLDQYDAIERNEIGSLTFICHVRRGRRVVHELRCSAANGALFHQSSILWEELTCSRNIVNRFFQ
jgi:hypothetical protein